MRYGVTGVREMWTPRDSLSRIRRWRKEVRRGGVLPRVFAAGALVEGDQPPWMPSVDRVASPPEARAFVRKAKAAGYDFVKVYSHLDPATYAAILDEAARLDMEVGGHVPLLVGIRDALRYGQRTNEHLHQVTIACTADEDDFLRERRAFYAGEYALEEEFALLDRQLHASTRSFSEERCREVGALIAAAGQWQVPTLVNERRWFLGVDSRRESPGLFAQVPDSIRAGWERGLSGGETYTGTPEALRAGWETYQRVTGILAQSGVRFLAGTDFAAPYIYPGYSLHREMELLVGAGLPPLAALQAATINPARYLGVDASFGSVDAGKIADLVILRENPLTDIRHTLTVAGVLLNGRLVDSNPSPGSSN